MPECVRTEVADFSNVRRALQFSPNSSVGIREPAEFDRTCKNPVFSSRKFGKLLTRSEPVQQFTCKIKRLRGAFGLNGVYNLLNDATPDAQP